MIMLSKRPVAMRIALRPLALAASLILSTPFALNATTLGTDLLEGQLLDGIGTGAGNLGTVPDIQNTLSNMLRDEAAIGTLASVLPQALQRLPDDRELRLLQAVVWAATGRDDDALAQIAQVGQEPPNVWHHVAEGLIARNAGDLARAAASLDKARALDPDNAYVHNTAGSIAFAAGDLEAAQEHFAQAVKSAPDGRVYYANLAATMIARDNLRSAQIILAESHRRHPAFCDTRLMEAGVHLSLGRSDAAEAALRICYEAEPDEQRAVSGLVEIALERADAATARQLLEDQPQTPTFDLARARVALFDGDSSTARTFLDAHPAEGSAKVLAAFADAMEGDLDTAIARLSAQANRTDAVLALAALQAAAGVVPDSASSSPTASFFMALNPAATGERRAALNAAEGFEQGFTAAGLDAVPQGSPDLALGVIFRLWGFHGAALERLVAASNADPENPLAAYFTAVAHLKLGQNAQAEAALAKARTAAPSFFAANIAAAELRIRAGAPQEALAMLKAAVAVREDPGALMRIGLIEESFGDDDTARAAYKRFVAVQPGSYIGYNQLAWHLARRGIELDRAQELAERANTLQPENASVLDTLGWIAFLRGDGAGAVERLRAAHEVSRGDVPIISFHLAQAELKHGEAPRGIALLQDLTAAGPAAYPFSQEAKDILAKALQ